MVYLAIKSSGLKGAMQAAATSGAAIWCGADAISSQDFADQTGKGLTRFAYDLAARDPLVIAGALDTIEQHHPGELIWIEAHAVQV